GRLSPEADHSPSLAERTLCRYTPEVGAVCGKVARPDLCGGREVTRVPTASEASGVHLGSRRRSGVAAPGAGPPLGHPRDRVLESRVAGVRCPPTDRPPTRFKPNRLRRRPELCD